MAEIQTIALDKHYRGYIAFNTSRDVKSDLTEVTKPNQFASFMMKHEDRRSHITASKHKTSAWFGV